MTRTEHLLWILAEECAEVAQRASKAARFGLAEVQPEQQLDNATRLNIEIEDLAAVVSMLRDERSIPSGGPFRRAEKREKVERFLRYLAECGTLTEGPSGPTKGAAGAEVGR